LGEGESVKPAAVTLSRVQRAVVTALVADKRREHPELAERPTFEVFKAIAEREGIILTFCKLGRKGMAVELLGELGIVLDDSLAGEELLHVAVHELGHVHMHLHTPAMKDLSLRARAELEANLYARLLLNETEPEYHTIFNAVVGSRLFTQKQEVV
jgi:hypothetical protein